MSDEELLKSGNMNNIALLFQKHDKLLYTAAFKGCKSEELARDVVQDCFIIVCQKYATYNGGNVGSWLFAIAYHRAIDLATRENLLKIELNVDYNYSGKDETPNCLLDNSFQEKEVARIENLDLLEWATSQMPDYQAQIIEGKIDGLSYKEIARKLNISFNKATSRVSRSLNTIKEIFNGQEIRNESEELR